MSQASEEYIHQSEAEQVMGTISALPSLMSQAQADYVWELLNKSILATFQKDNIVTLLNSGNLTMDQANRIITALLEQQTNPLDRVKNGELLLQSDLKKAIKKTCDDPNT
jgi:hypothetical protein